MKIKCSLLDKYIRTWLSRKTNIADSRGGLFPTARNRSRSPRTIYTHVAIYTCRSWARWWSRGRRDGVARGGSRVWRTRCRPPATSPSRTRAARGRLPPRPPPSGSAAACSPFVVVESKIGEQREREIEKKWLALLYPFIRTSRAFPPCKHTRGFMCACRLCV